MKIFLYVDANNLYGHSMSQPLPYNEFKFEKDICLKEMLNIPDDCDTGYFLEADLSYPYNLRQKTEQFPFSPETKSISKENFKDYMKKN